MSITQRYWLTFAPGFILAGFFSLWLLCAMFVVTYPCYYAHRKEWSVGRFALLAVGITITLFMMAALRQ
jgi:hypothetical protein